MNRQNNQHELIVSGIHLELTPSLKTFVGDKVERLFRHEERIVRIRVELECDPKQAVSSDECHKAISLMIDKLDRMLERRNSLHKVKRNHPHAIELDTELPKAM
jgi:putative sigma-54 modulation protein